MRFLKLNLANEDNPIVTHHEAESLESLWKTVIRCDEDSKVLCPIGAYVASENDGASFAIQDQ